MTTMSCPMCQADLSTGYTDTCNRCGADLGRVMPKPPKIAVFETPLKIEAGSNLGRGVLGACAGALVGAALMFGLFMVAGIRFPLFGTGIGALCGLGAKWLNKGGEEKLGMIAGGISLAAVFGTLFLMYGTVPMFNVISMLVSVSVAFRIASK